MLWLVVVETKKFGFFSLNKEVTDFFTLLDPQEVSHVEEIERAVISSDNQYIAIQSAHVISLLQLSNLRCISEFRGYGGSVVHDIFVR